MVGQFLAGVIIGVLIGLALAPVLRSWILWQMAKPWRDGQASSRFDNATPTAARRER